MKKQYIANKSLVYECLNFYCSSIVFVLLEGDYELEYDIICNTLVLYMVIIMAVCQIIIEKKGNTYVIGYLCM